MLANKALVRTQTTLRFVCAAQLGRYVQKSHRLSFATNEYVRPGFGLYYWWNGAPE